MKHYNKKPITSGSIQGAVNGKFGIPSKTLVFRNSMKTSSILSIGRKSSGMHMSRPKSSWSNPQNAPPVDQSGQSNVRNA
jgi:hypothetical protein